MVHPRTVFQESSEPVHACIAIRPFCELNGGGGHLTKKTYTLNQECSLGSAFFDEQSFRTIQFLLDHAEAGAQLQGLPYRRGGGGLWAEEPLDLRPQPLRLEPQHQGELEGGDEVGVHGELLHALARLPALHAEVDEGPPQAAGLAGRQVQELLADVLQQFLGDEQFGTTQGALRVFGFSQGPGNQVHHFLQDGLLHWIIEQVFGRGRQVTGEI